MMTLRRNPPLYRRWEPGAGEHGLGLVQPGDVGDEIGSFWDDFWATSPAVTAGGGDVLGDYWDWLSTPGLDWDSLDTGSTTDLSAYMRAAGLTKTAAGAVKTANGQTLNSSTDLTNYLKSIGIVTNAAGKLVNANGQTLSYAKPGAGGAPAPAGQWFSFATNKQVLTWGGVSLFVVLVLPSLLDAFSGGGRRRR